MSIVPILRDNSLDRIYIDRTSNTDSYPVLKVNSEVIDFVKGNDTIVSDLDYFEKDFSKIIDFNTLRLIIRKLRSDQLTLKTSSRISFVPTRYFTLLKVSNSSSQRDKFNSLFVSEINKNLLREKALDLGYNNTFYNTTKRKRHYINPITGEEYSTINYQGEETPKKVITLEDMKYHLDRVLYSWESLRKSLKNQNCLSVPVDLTMGSVAPLFKNTTFEEGYFVVNVDYIYNEVNDATTYKKSISINSKESSGSLLEGVQILWLLPNTKDSLIKIVWDKSLVDSARIVSINLIKYK